MNTGRSEPSDHSSPITLWSVTQNGQEARCVVDRGTLLHFVNGQLRSSSRFTGTDELISLTSAWQLELQEPGTGEG